MPGKKKDRLAQRGQGATVRVAGGVVGRSHRPGQVEVAVIHRRLCGDWMLPQGRLNPGENASGSVVFPSGLIPIREQKSSWGRRDRFEASLECVD